MTAVTPRIQLVIDRGDRSSQRLVAGEQVTDEMLDVAEELLETLTTGTRPPLKGDLYALCAQAFGTTREDAKQRLFHALYSPPPEAQALGHTYVGGRKFSGEQLDALLADMNATKDPVPTKHVHRTKRRVVIGLGCAGYRASCSCGWKSKDDPIRSVIVDLASEHNYEHFRSAP